MSLDKLQYIGSWNSFSLGKVGVYADEFGVLIFSPPNGVASLEYLVRDGKISSAEAEDIRLFIVEKILEKG